MADMRLTRAYLSDLNAEGERLLFERIHALIADFDNKGDTGRSIRILDIGCGDCRYWTMFRRPSNQCPESERTRGRIEVTLVDKAADCCTAFLSTDYDDALEFSFFCAEYPFERSFCESLLEGGSYDLVVCSAVFHELRQQAVTRRLTSTGLSAPRTCTGLARDIILGLLGTGLIRPGGLLLVGDLVDQTYWDSSILNIVRSWQKDRLPGLINSNEMGHADPHYSFFLPSEIVSAAISSGFMVDIHEECPSLPKELHNRDLEFYKPFENDTCHDIALRIRSVLRSRKYYLLTLRLESKATTRDCDGEQGSSAGINSFKYDHRHDSRCISSPLEKLRNSLARTNQRTDEVARGIFQRHVCFSETTPDTLFQQLAKSIIDIVRHESEVERLASPGYLSLWPSVNSTLLAEMGSPHRFLTNGLMDKNFDGKPYVYLQNSSSIAEDWVSLCYDALFSQRAGAFCLNGKNRMEIIEIPSLFKLLTTGGQPSYSGILSLAICSLGESSDARKLLHAVEPDDRAERLKGFNITQGSIGKIHRESYAILLSHSLDKRSDLLGNARKVDDFFNKDLCLGNGGLTGQIRLSILAVYLDFIFAGSGRVGSVDICDAVNLIKNRWIGENSHNIAFLRNADIEGNLGSDYHAVLPFEYQDYISVLCDRLLNFAQTTGSSSPLAWHLFPGSNFLNQSDVTGNLMVFTDKVVPASTCGVVRILHDEMLNLFQRVDDEAVLSRKNELIKLESERAARAAIMSRNLSHNVGSHALASSRFFASVGVLHEARGDSPEILTYEHAIAVKTDGAERNKEESEIGLEPRTEVCGVREGEVWRARQRLATFNGFIQGRLDFIARALGEASSTPEPMFLVGDVLKGFLSQRVLLNTLLSDNGITIEQMEFHVVLPNSKGTIVYRGINPQHDQQLRHFDFDLVNYGGMLEIPDATTEEKDVLVSIPGGMIGRHAVYAFLENIMRNAAKYGERKEYSVSKRRKNGERIETEVRENVVPLIVRLELKDGFAVKRGNISGNPCPCYWLEISDNRSIDKKKVERAYVVGEVSRAVRRFLNDPIITADGKAQIAGHGIQEMKVCADFLADQELCFPNDDDWTTFVQAIKNDSLLMDSSAERSAVSYKCYIDDNETKLKEGIANESERTSWIRLENSLQAWYQESPFTSKTENGDNALAEPHLTYRLILQKPVIFGIVDISLANSPNCQAITPCMENPSVVFYRDIETLASNSAYFGLICVTSSDVQTMQKVIKEIARCHYALPYRLMLITSSAESQKTWQEAINYASAGPGAPYIEVSADVVELKRMPGCLPTRRVFAVSLPSLFEEPNIGARVKRYIPSFGNKAEKDSIVAEREDTDQSTSCEGQRIFQAVYEAWLLAWKGHEFEKHKPRDSQRQRDQPNATIPKDWQWHLWIGFDRKGDDSGNSQIQAKWERLRQFRSDLIKIKVQEAGNIKGAIRCGGRNDDTGVWSGNKNLIVYDNHGGVFQANGIGQSADLFTAPTCYHSFSGSGQIDLFHSLETPPQDLFGLSFFLFSLLEASLLSVVVVDERVAEAMLGRSADQAGVRLYTSGKHTSLQLARVYPIFQIKRANEPIHYLSPSVEEAIKNTDSHLNDPNGDWAPIDGKQRLYLAESEGITVKCHNDSAKIEPFVYYGDDDGLLQLAQLSKVDHVRSGTLDLLVVHEGVLDAIGREWWTKEHPAAYFHQIPFFVRTSGRGSASRHEGSHLPFLEFSELSESSYQSLNKLSLGRSLLGLRGRIRNI